MDAKQKLLTIVESNRQNSARWYETSRGDLIAEARSFGLVVAYQDTTHESYLIWIPGKGDTV